MRVTKGTSRKRILKEDHERDLRTVSVVEKNTARPMGRNQGGEK